MDNWIYVSNTAGRNPQTKLIPEDILEQTHQVFANIETALAAVDASLADVVCSRVFIQDPKDVPAVMGLIGEKFRGVDPASTVTCPPLGSTVYKVETGSDGLSQRLQGAGRSHPPVAMTATRPCACAADLNRSQSLDHGPDYSAREHVNHVPLRDVRRHHWRRDYRLDGCADIGRTQYRGGGAGKRPYRRRTVLTQPRLGTQDQPARRRYPLGPRRRSLVGADA